jgi:hypothetical protein
VFRKILYICLMLCLGLFLKHIFEIERRNAILNEYFKTEQELSVLNDQERKAIEDLFNHFFFFDEFAYPLFGSKPMSIGRFFDSFEPAWKAWEKVAPLFQSREWILTKYSFHEKEFVLIANLSLIEKVYFENKAIFDQALGEKMTIEDLKSSLKAKNELFQKVMQNDLLLGVLLGYGARNAQLFAANDRAHLKPFTAIHPIFYYFSKIPPPYFACDPTSAETLELKMRYREELAAIIKMNQEKPLFLRMLLLLKDQNK